MNVKPDEEWFSHVTPMTEEEFQEPDSEDLWAALETAHAMGIPVDTDEQRMWFCFLRD